MPPRRSRHCQTILLALLYAVTAGIVFLGFHWQFVSQLVDDLQTLTSDKLIPIAEGIKAEFETGVKDSLHIALHAAMNASYSVSSIKAGVEQKIEEEYRTKVRELAQKAVQIRADASTILANAQKDDALRR